MSAPANPLAALLADWLPATGADVVRHGYEAHGRDYAFVLGLASGLCEVTFTHVVELAYETRVRDELWPLSWDDIFTDYEQWRRAGEPDGYVWAAPLSTAYPGIRAPAWSREAHAWTHRLKRPMFSMSIETDRFRLALVFHDVRTRWLSE